VRFDDAGRAQALELTTLVLILAAGGLTTHWAYALAAAPAARVSRARLATVGVAVSGLAVAVAAYWLLALTWRNALLLSAVLPPTDATAVFSVRRKLPLPPRLSGCWKDGRGSTPRCRTR
jgi:potassium/hydrogen antiporter